MFCLLIPNLRTRKSFFSSVLTVVKTLISLAGGCNDRTVDWELLTSAPRSRAIWIAAIPSPPAPEWMSTVYAVSDTAQIVGLGFTHFVLAKISTMKQTVQCCSED